MEEDLPPNWGRFRTAFAPLRLWLGWRQCFDSCALELDPDGEHFAGEQGPVPPERVYDRREYHPPGGRVEAYLSPQSRRDVSR